MDDGVFVGPWAYDYQDRTFEPDSYNPVAKGSGPFYFPDGRARFNVADYRPPVDDASDEYPIYLTTGRVVSQFLSGTQTRRIGPLVKQYAEPRIEMHPRLAAKLGIADGDWATAETRRGTITLKAQVVTTIRPDTVFIPYHWPGRRSARSHPVSADVGVSFSRAGAESAHPFECAVTLTFTPIGMPRAT